MSDFPIYDWTFVSSHSLSRHVQMGSDQIIKYWITVKLIFHWILCTSKKKSMTIIGFSQGHTKAQYFRNIRLSRLQTTINACMRIFTIQKCTFLSYLLSKSRFNNYYTTSKILMLKLIKNIYMYPTSVQWFVWLKFENACILLCPLNIICPHSGNSGHNCVPEAVSRAGTSNCIPQFLWDVITRTYMSLVTDSETQVLNHDTNKSHLRFLEIT